MRIFRRIKKATGQQFFLALDIGTSSIKALVCEHQGNLVKVLGYGSVKPPAGTMKNGQIVDMGALINTAILAIKKAENSCGVATSKIIIGISGEFVKGAITTTSYIRRDSKKKLDLAELKNIVHKVQWRAFDKARNQLSEETGYNEVDVKLVNSAIVDLQIDGYRIKNPIGFQGKEIALSIYNAFAPLNHYGALQTIAAELHKELVAVASEPYALAKSLKESGRKNFNAIFINIGSGVTDVSMVISGVVQGTKMFSIGGDSFTKRISHQLNISFKEAEEIKLLYANDKLERHSHKIVRECLNQDIKMWLSGVNFSLEGFEEVKTLPTKVFISGGSANLPEIKEILESREWYKTLNFSKKPQINMFHPKLISEVSDETKSLNDPANIMPLSLARLAIDISSEQQALAQILKKVVRLMQV